MKFSFIVPDLISLDVSRVAKFELNFSLHKIYFSIDQNSYYHDRNVVFTCIVAGSVLQFPAF